MKGLRRCLPFGGGGCCCGEGAGGRGGGGVADGLVWDVPLKAHASGDYSVAVAQANEALEDQAQVIAAPAATLVGVFDGHGGPEAARFRQQAPLLPYPRLCGGERWPVGGGVPEGVRRDGGGVHRPGAEILAVAAADRLRGLLLPGGRHRGRDARRGGGNRRVVAERLSQDHNVADEDVRREVAQMHPDEPHIVLNGHGVWRIKGIIQVSRSIGDVYLKKPDICRNNPALQHSLCPFSSLRRAVMSAVPSITTRQLRPGDRFLIFASDGLWEQLSSDEAAVGIVAANPRKGVVMCLVRAAQLEAARKKAVKYDKIRTIEKGRRRQYHNVLFLDKQCRGAARSGPEDIDGTYAPLDVFSYSPDGDHEDPTKPPSCVVDTDRSVCLQRAVRG